LYGFENSAESSADGVFSDPLGDNDWQVITVNSQTGRAFEVYAKCPAGTLNLDDVRSGVVRHALLVTFANGYINPIFLWPATTNSVAYGTALCAARLRLKSAFDISGFSPTAHTATSIMATSVDPR
jgi:hypothetical protein